MLAEGATPTNITLARLRRALPEREMVAVEAWLSTFYPFQLRWILDWSRFSLLLKARQIGASHTFAAAAVLWSLFGETTSVVSIGERESGEVLLKAERHAKVLAALGSSWAACKPTATEVSFASGGRIIALPSTSAARGYSGNVVLDEFAYHLHPEHVWDGAAGATLHGFKLRLISTPNGTGNLYHEVVTDPKAHKGYSRHAVTIEDAIGEGLRIDLDTCWKMARGNPRVFDQMFRCAFLDAATQYIPTSLIHAACVADTYCIPVAIYAGLDIGRSNDRTVLVVVAVDAMGIGWVIDIQRRKRTETEDLVELASLALNHYGARRLCVDATGMGAFPASDLQKIFGRHRVEPVAFTAQVKEDLATTMYQRFANHQAKIPQIDTELRDDLTAIRRIVTAAGNVRYDAPVTEKGHADSAWALALAFHGYNKPPNVRREIGPEATSEVA